MNINPYAWLLTIPITIGLVQIYFQPADNIFKRIWRDAVRLEQFTWERLGFSMCKGRGRRVHRALFGAIVSGFAIASIASFGSFIGWWH